MTTDRTTPSLGRYGTHNFETGYDHGERSDHPKHAAFAVGDHARGPRIFDVYGGAQLTVWRRSLAAAGEKADPCRTCRQKALEGPKIGVDVS